MKPATHSIRTLRQLRGWSQYDLADRTGRPQGWVSALEAGRIAISDADVHKLAEVFDLPASVIAAYVRVKGADRMPMPSAVDPYSQLAGIMLREFQRRTCPDATVTCTVWPSGKVLISAGPPEAPARKRKPRKEARNG